MFLATKKENNISAVVAIDGEDCTFDYLASIIDINKTKAVIGEDGKIASPCCYSSNGRELKQGEVIAISEGAIVDVEIFKLCRFHDTKGSYTLIKQQAIGVIGEDVNGGGYPSKLTLTDGSIVHIGEWVCIDKSGSTSKCDKDDCNLHQQVLM